MINLRRVKQNPDLRENGQEGTSDPPAASGSPGPTRDPRLTTRRVVAFATSIVLGAVAVALAIRFYLKTDLLRPTLPFIFLNIPLWLLAAIPMSLFFLIWIDYFLGTRIIGD
jgi:hypothetical protein